MDEAAKKYGIHQGPADIANTTNKGKEVSWEGWKDLMKAKQSQIVERNSTFILPLRVKIDFRRNGTMILKFNQKIEVPDASRRLASLDQINVTE